MNYQFHEVANIFPMMSQEEFANLIKDIRDNGQREAIWTYQGKIIDGRNRYRACAELGIEPTTREWDGQGSLVSFVTSMNLHRRHLSESQRGMVAVRMAPIYVEEAKKRMLAGVHLDPGANCPQGTPGKTRDKVAAILNVSDGTVARASRVQRLGIPEISQAVENGEMSVSRADVIVREPKEKQRELLQQHKEPAKPRPTRKDNTPVVTPEPHIEAPELQKILEDMSSCVSISIARAEDEIIKMEIVGNFRHVINSYVDALHKSAERLEISLKIKLGGN